MTLITFGNKTKSNVSKFEASNNQESLIKAISGSIEKLHSEIFINCNSRKYPAPSHRVFLVLCGCLSFFHRYFRPISEGWAMYFTLSVLREGNLANILEYNNIENEAEKIQVRIRDIHQEIELAYELQLNEIKPYFGYFLSSNFQASKEDQNKYKGKLDEMINSWAVLSDGNT